MSETKSAEWQLAVTLEGLPKLSDFKLVSCNVPALAEGHILVKAKFISVDPYLRGRISGLSVGAVPVAGCVAEVIAVNPESKFAVGDTVFDYMPWREYNLIKESSPMLYKVPIDTISPSTSLGVLGMPGMTAYFGLERICKPKKGEVVLVTGASGAVGSLVGQLAKAKGCFVVGTCGSTDKCDYIRSLGFDVALNYKDYSDLKSATAALTEAFPDGKLDCFFDNTGGNMSDAAFFLLNKYARIAICGQIATYNAIEVPQGPRLLSKLIYTHSTIQGFMVYDYAGSPEAQTEFQNAVRPLVASGKLQFTETFTDGFEGVIEAFIGLFSGANTGKAVVRIE